MIVTGVFETGVLAFVARFISNTINRIGINVGGGGPPLSNWNDSRRLD
jgi:hypothetical protein